MFSLDQFPSLFQCIKIFDSFIFLFKILCLLSFLFTHFLFFSFSLMFNLVCIFVAFLLLLFFFERRKDYEYYFSFLYAPSNIPSSFSFTSILRNISHALFTSWHFHDSRHLFFSFLFPNKFVFFPLFIKAILFTCSDSSFLALIFFLLVHYSFFLSLSFLSSSSCLISFTHSLTLSLSLSAKQRYYSRCSYDFASQVTLL